MSLADFQRAMADLAGSPTLCGRLLRDDPGALDGYSLSDRERTRLVSVVRQPGMATNCTIHRATRMLPLDTLLPLTCAALGKALADEVDAYWSSAPRPAIRFDVEAARFVAHLMARAEDVGRQWPFDRLAILDLARLELAMETLRIAPRESSPPVARGAVARHRLSPEARVLRLAHDPRVLLSGARRVPPDLSLATQGSHMVVLVARTGRLDLFTVPTARIAEVERLQEGGEAAHWLIEHGLAVPDLLEARSAVQA